MWVRFLPGVQLVVYILYMYQGYREQPTREGKRIELPPVPQEVALLLKGIKEDREDYSDFGDYYSESEISKDKALVQKIEEGFQNKLSKMKPHKREALIQQAKKSDLLEAFFVSQVTQAEWFGKGSVLFPTKKLDDLVHGTDLICEYNEDERKHHAGINMDVTFSFKELESKLADVQQEVEQGVGGSVKYHQGSEGAGLDHMPRFIIGVSDERAVNLLQIWFDQYNNTQDVKDLNKKLVKNHPAQIVCFLQMKEQAAVYRELAEARFNTKLAAKLSDAQQFIESLMKEKDDLYQRYKTKIDNDPILLRIKTYANTLRKEIPAIHEAAVEDRVDQYLGVNKYADE